MRRDDYERQPAPDFLFQRRSLRHHRHDPQSGEATFIAGNQPPHRAIRLEECVIRRRDAPTLTITSDPNNFIVVVAGSGPDWSLRLWAEGGGQKEAEAAQRLEQCAFGVTGSTVSLRGPNLYERRDARSELLVEAPADAGVVIHASYAAVEVRDMAGPVRIAATHARATILDTSGQVDAVAGCVDFCGSRGRVTLSAESEINLKMTRPMFDGTLVAWAQRPVRMLVPPEFTTPFEVMVRGRNNFVCRANFRSKVKQNRQGPLYVFTYGARDDDGLSSGLHLRSDEAPVVIDQL